MGDKVRGYLVVNVAEASGKNKDDEVVWDPSFTEGFCKGQGSPCLAAGGSRLPLLAAALESNTVLRRSARLLNSPPLVVRSQWRSGAANGM